MSKRRSSTSDEPISSDRASFSPSRFRRAPAAGRRSFVVVPAYRRIDRPRSVRQRTMTTDEHLDFGMSDNGKAGTPQHRFGAGAVWNPPIGRVARIAFLDEVHLGKAGPLKHLLLPEI